MVRDTRQAKRCVAWGGRPRLGRKVVAHAEAKNQNQPTNQTKKNPACRSSEPGPGLPCLCGKMRPSSTPTRSLRAVGAWTGHSPSPATTHPLYFWPFFSFPMLFSAPCPLLPPCCPPHPSRTLLPSFCSYLLGAQRLPHKHPLSEPRAPARARGGAACQGELGPPARGLPPHSEAPRHPKAQREVASDAFRDESD